MRSLLFLAWLSLMGCSVSDDGHLSANARSRSVSQPGSPDSVARDIPNDERASPFTGVWEACGDGTPPDQCSRYLLVQSGARICGTWSEVATNQGYYGQLIAETVSATEARWTKICGRPGADTRVECGDGWQAVDKPLRLCGERLGNLESANGGCYAAFDRVATSNAELDSLMTETWVEACLAGDTDTLPPEKAAIARVTMPEALHGVWHMGDAPCAVPHPDSDGTLLITAEGWQGYEHRGSPERVQAAANHHWMIEGEEIYLGSQHDRVSRRFILKQGTLVISEPGYTETYQRCRMED